MILRVKFARENERVDWAPALLYAAACPSLRDSLVLIQTVVVARDVQA